MGSKNQGLSRNVSIPRFVFIVSVAALIGIAAGTGLGNRSRLQTGLAFQDGNQEFCADKRRLNIEIADLDLEFNKGYSDPVEAVARFEADLHAAASGAALPEGKTLPAEIYELLEPSRQFHTTERKDVANANAIYFDLPSSEGDTLEARIVVEAIGGAYYVVQAYICEAVLVSDPVLFDQLWAEEVNKGEN
ncbi:MAG: hypothetical protein ACRDFQ_10165 [Anaerolineales bacterium]